MTFRILTNKNNCWLYEIVLTDGTTHRFTREFGTRTAAKKAAERMVRKLKKMLD